jgi:hypothetical protein
MKTHVNGAIAAADHGTYAALSFPYDTQTQTALKETFGPDNVVFDRGTTAWSVRYTGDKSFANVVKFADTVAPRVTEVTQSRKNAADFVARPDIASKYPGLEIKAVSGKLGIVIPNVADATRALKDVGARWVPKGQMADQKTGEVIKTGGYWGVVLSDTTLPKIDAALTIAAGAMAKHTRDAGIAAEIKPSHDAMQVLTSGPRVLVETANDRTANEMLTKAGFVWDKPAGAYGITVSDANKEHVQTTLAKVGTYFDGLVVQPTLEQPGVSKSALDAGLAVKASPSDDKELAHLKAAASFVDRAFSTAEKQDLATLKPGEHTQSESPRLAALKPETFSQVAGMVAHVGNVQQAHQAARVQAAQQEIARAQTQGQSQGQAVGR